MKLSPIFFILGIVFLSYSFVSAPKKLPHTNGPQNVTNLLEQAGDLVPNYSKGILEYHYPTRKSKMEGTIPYYTAPNKEADKGQLSLSQQAQWATLLVSTDTKEVRLKAERKNSQTDLVLIGRHFHLKYFDEENDFYKVLVNELGDAVWLYETDLYKADFSPIQWIDVIANTEESYVVNVQTCLNVRSTPEIKEGNVLQCLLPIKYGELVDIYFHELRPTGKIQGDWAEFYFDFDAVTYKPDVQDTVDFDSYMAAKEKVRLALHKKYDAPPKSKGWIKVVNEDGSLNVWFQPPMC